MRSTRFSLRLLGEFEVLRDGRPLSVRCSGKMGALLGYLAAESARTHSRRALGAMLWPEQDEDHARQSLRQALTGLRRLLGDGEGPASLFRIDRDSLGFNRAGTHDIDIAALETVSPAECSPGVLRSRAACRECHRVAATYYRGEFLAGLSVPDAPEFESWLDGKRHWFGRRAAEVFADLAACYEQSGQFQRALQYARAQLRVDPWNEEAHRQVMRLLTVGGERNAAIAHYRHVCSLLRNELGVDPEEETRALREQIEAGLIEPVAALPAERVLHADPGAPRVCAAAPPGHAGERRLLTVLSCEARCAPEEDPEALHERSSGPVARAGQIVRQFGGHVIESDGIGFTAYFGYPLRCNEPSLQAVRAAVALRDVETGEQPLRIRVHSDVVFVPPRRRASCDIDASIVGTVPRSARALHHVASEVDLAISAKTYALVLGAVECRSIPGQLPPVSGAPGEVYEVVRVLEESERIAAAPVNDVQLQVSERVDTLLDQLGRAKALAQLASSIGQEFTEARLILLLGQLQNLGLDPPALAEELERLVGAGILQSWTDASATWYRFPEPTVREAAYRSQSRTQQHLYARLLAGLLPDARIRVPPWN
ncbi:MAG TPA: BTAD domain-containing putative transcriptional regulator [Steroidobacteraceae bacterium]|nr:BTAD domain-containing putative transcriptional regulator [Steroidobacteraceae bacterium]